MFRPTLLPIGHCWRELCWRGRPNDRFTRELRTQESTNLDGLRVHRLQRGGTNPVGRCQQQPVREPTPVRQRPARLAQKRINISLRDRVVLVVALRLNRPQLALHRLSHQIDPGVKTPPVGPLIPQPHLTQPRAIPGRVLQEPPANQLKLMAPNTFIGIEALEKLEETCRHGDLPESKREPPPQDTHQPPPNTPEITPTAKGHTTTKELYASRLAPELPACERPDPGLKPQRGVRERRSRC